MSGKPYKQYYKELYAIQDVVFKIMEDYDFYLTGGTALSRFYLNHRYSDDLDFFVHQKTDFLDDVKKIIAKLKTHFKLETRVMTTDFSQFFVHSENFYSHAAGVIKIARRAPPPLIINNSQLILNNSFPLDP